MLPAAALVRRAIDERGALPFSDVLELALYDPAAGFYATGGRAGRRGDFLTSPEVGPLFGAVVARALDRWWHDAGRPSRFTVAEAGAGPGTLARAVRAAEPECAASLRYVLVERSAAQRDLHVSLVDGEGAWRSADRLPEPGGADVVLANELLDNLPFDLLERTATGWAEVRVGVEGDRLVEVLGPLSDAVASVEGAPLGARVPVQRAAAAWLGDALACVGPAGRVVVLDYATTTADLATRSPQEWLRTYRAHARGAGPLEELGAQDVTCEVCVDQLTAVSPPGSDRSQAEWLRSHGIEQLVEEGRRTWTERAAIGDLAAVRARSRVTEAEALLDRDGLGGFRVLEWGGLA